MPADRMRQGPIYNYAGRIVQVVFFYRGSDTLVDHWRYTIGGRYIDRDDPESFGLTEGDLVLLDERVAALLRRTEGWRESDVVVPPQA